MTVSLRNMMSQTKLRDIQHAKYKRWLAAFFIVIFSAINWVFSLNVLGSFQHVMDELENALNKPAEVPVGRRYGWTHNITDFPVFMLQWPTDPFKPHQCNFMNRSIPHTFTISAYPKSYDLQTVFGAPHNNLDEAWDQVGANTNKGEQANISGDGQPTVHQIKEALCTIAETSWIRHFPHLMQNLMPCWSLWQHFQDAKHVLVVGKFFQDKYFHTTEFQDGLYSILKASKVTISYQFVENYMDNNKLTPADVVVAHANMTLRSGYRAAHTDDMPQLRQATLTMLGMDHYIDQSCGVTFLTEPSTSDDANSGDNATDNPRRPPRIAIANRKIGRRFHGAHDVAAFLEDQFDLPYKPPVFLMEDMSFEHQVELFANIDILLTPHSEYLASLPFMPRCGSVIELFPYGYNWNQFFGSLAGISGLNHSFIYLGEDWDVDSQFLQTREQKESVRMSEVCAPAHRVIEAVKIQVHQWHRCCGFIP